MSIFDVSIFKQPKQDLIKKIILAIIGTALSGIGIALNSCVGFGTDPISVFSDGIHAFLKIDLGTAFNITNSVLFLVVFIFGRRYINIGTLIHALFLGFFVDLGTNLYGLFYLKDEILFKTIIAVFACMFLLFGIAILIAVSIGVDVWTGLALLLRDRSQKEYKFFRVAIDIFCLIVGFCLGGEVGAVTVLLALFGGSIIQAFTKFIKESIFVRLKFKDNNF